MLIAEEYNTPFPIGSPITIFQCAHQMMMPVMKLGRIFPKVVSFHIAAPPEESSSAALCCWRVAFPVLGVVRFISLDEGIGGRLAATNDKANIIIKALLLLLLLAG